MRVQVFRMHIPAMSTIGYGEGSDERDRRMPLLEDHRLVRELERASSHAIDPIYAEVDAWQIIKECGQAELRNTADLCGRPRRTR